MKNLKKSQKSCAVLLAAALLLSAGSFPAAARHTAAPKTVTLGGQPFGVRFFSDGVMVTELEPFYSENHYVCPAKDGGLQVGDVIQKVNGVPVTTNEALQHETFACSGKPVRFTVQRSGKELVKTVTPQQNMAGMYLLGAWVRDSCAGIGTVTYYDTQSGSFAALGHGICDKDTGGLLPLGSAEVVQVRVNAVSKSVSGKAGSLNGYFSDTPLGNLTKNTPCGVYGTINDKMQPQGVTLEIADNGDIHTGKAQIYTTVTGSECAAFDAEITKICHLEATSNENFVIKVTDKQLLDKCGGIVQGMSGSPIVQEGKLVGAVTHVFLNNPHEGYGITAQNMVSNCGN